MYGSTLSVGRKMRFTPFFDSSQSDLKVRFLVLELYLVDLVAGYTMKRGYHVGKHEIWLFYVYNFHLTPSHFL